tara:strand:+ start:68 stop:502 length:435 start_codon:yes stop_codon:yes gene_type:complete
MNSLSFGKVYYKGLLVRKNTKGRYINSGGKKIYLPKGTRATTKKIPVKKQSPKRTTRKKDYSKLKIKSPTTKTVYYKPKDKRRKKVEVGERYSARAIYNIYGTKAIGRALPILQPNGKLKIKYLRIRSNGSPYFSNKFGYFHFG